LLERLAGTKLSPSILSPIVEQLDGWAAGLQVTGLALRHKPASLILNASEMATSNSLMAYMLDEVLMRQPQAVQRFLIKTSILNELNQALCNAICGQENTHHDQEEAVPLEDLVQQGLFISTVNEAEGVYQYHALFQQVLKDQLKAQYSPRDIEELYRRASDWHANCGHLDEALQYALQIQDYTQAGSIIIQYRYTLMNENQWQRLEYWLRKLPRQFINASPELLVSEAFLAHVRFRRSESQALLAQIDDLIARLPASDKRKQLEGESACLHAQHLYDNNDLAKAWELVQTALQHIPRENEYGHIVARLTGCAIQLAFGNRTAAFDLVFQAFTEDGIEHDQEDGYKMSLLIILCFLNAYVADLSNQQQAAREALKYETQLNSAANIHKWSNNLNWARYHLGMVHYYRNELEQAEALLSIVVSQRYQSHVNCAIQSMFLLALTHQAQGRRKDAIDTADLASQHALEMRSMALLPVIDIFKAQLALQQGHFTEAIQRAANITPPGVSGPQWRFFIPHLTVARVQMAIGTLESLHEAETILKQLHAQARQHHNSLMLMNVLADLALFADIQDDTRLALLHLEQALMMAQVGGHIRIFADLGSRMNELLSRLHSRKVSPRFIRQVQKAFTNEQTSNPVPTQSELPEPLTNRELEVLELMHKRLRNKEIAESLFVSTGTVKHHIHSIYQKLAVSSRRDAMIKAMELNLLKGQVE
jgi:LuxR family maltose regulon positive regulatory protein